MQLSKIQTGRFFLLAILFILLVIPFFISQEGENNEEDIPLSVIAARDKLITENIPKEYADVLNRVGSTRLKFEKKEGVTSISVLNKGDRSSKKIELYLNGEDKSNAFKLGYGSTLKFKGDKLVEATINNPNVCDKGGCPLEVEHNQRTPLGDYKYLVDPGDTIKFKAGENGAPDEVTVISSSGANFYKPEKLESASKNSISPKVSYKLSKDVSSVTLNKEYEFSSEAEADSDVVNGEGSVLGGTKDIGLIYDAEVNSFSLIKDADVDGFKLSPSGEEGILLKLGEEINPERSNFYLDKDSKQVKGYSPIGQKGFIFEITPKNKYNIPVGKNLLTGAESPNDLFLVRVTAEGTDYLGKSFSSKFSSFTMAGTENPAIPGRMEFSGPAMVLNGMAVFSTDSKMEKLYVIPRGQIEGGVLDNYLKENFDLDLEMIKQPTSTPMLFNFKDNELNELLHRDPETGEPRDLYVGINGDYIAVNSGTEFNENNFNEKFAVNYLDSNAATFFKVLSRDDRIAFLSEFRDRGSNQAVIQAYLKLGREQFGPQGLLKSMPQANKDFFGALLNVESLQRVESPSLSPLVNNLKTKGLIGGVEMYNVDKLNDPNTKVHVKIGTEWCSPCKLMDDDIREKYIKGDGAYIIINFQNEDKKVNADLQNLAKKLGFDGGSIPQSFIYQNGVKRSLPVGYQNFFK